VMASPITPPPIITTSEVLGSWFMYRPALAPISNPLSFRLSVIDPTFILCETFNTAGRKQRNAISDYYNLKSAI
jgi:hypothetical protein